MSGQKLVILAVIALGMVVWAVSLSQPDKATGPAQYVATYLIQGLAPESIAIIEIGTGDDKIELRRSGKGYIVPSKDNYPASTEQINELINNCLDIKTTERITDDADNHADLGVTKDKARSLIRFLDAEKNVVTGVFIGSGDDDSSKTYARLATADDVFGVESAPYFRSRDVDYLDQELLSITRGDVNTVTVASPNDTYTLKSPNSSTVELASVPAGKKLKTTDAGTVVNALSSLRFDDVKKGPDSKLRFDRSYVCVLNNKVTYTLKIAQADDKTYATLDADYREQVTINPQAKDSEDVLKEKEAKLKRQADVKLFQQRHRGWIYEIPSWKASNLVKDLDELLEDLPKPDPPAEPIDVNALTTPNVLGLPEN